MNNQLIRYLQRQLLLGEAIMRSKNKNSRGRPLPTRTMIVLIQKYIRDFLLKKPGTKRWIILPGLRGVGKTTLLAQSYLWLLPQSHDKLNLLYVSLDEVVEKVGSSLSELIDEYERLLGISYEQLDKPTFIFIDEVQTDPKWARTVKFLYDRTPYVFLICSGSSAVHLQMDADIDGRRAVTEKLFPLSFPEYQVLAYNVLPKKDLKKQLIRSLYYGTDAVSVYKELQDLALAVDQQWTRYNRNSITKYLQTGTIPFTLGETDIRQVYTAIDSMVDKIISIDIQALNQFKSETVGALKRLIFVLTDCDVMTYENMAKAVGVSRSQVINMIDALVKAELIIKVPAHGNNITATTNPSKFFFMSPAIRAAFHDIVGLPDTVASRKGKLLEDAAALHFYREFVTKKEGSITYPFEKEGGQSDFILRVDNDHQIAVEVGLGTKGYDQSAKTLKKFGGSYGLVFSDSPLGINEEKTVVTVPLDYFFCM
ncbi:MAG TPA: AAA family ATPase [Candidatus Binatia bacterium]|nr:AAA family ATPase [Candidatus Binatia bacterium]